MAKVTAADLKKHHYWILSGLAPLFALLAVLFLWLRVGSAVSAEVAATKKDVDAVKAVKPKGKKAIEDDYPKQQAELVDQKKKLWEANYEKQKAMFEWPRQPLLQQLEARYPKFGQPIPNTEEGSLSQIAKPEVYEAAYDRLGEAVQPTQFAGGSWKAVLRHVSNWTQIVPTDKRLWLALEDLWVQRGLLLPINDINAAASAFKLVPPAAGQKDDPLRRTFQSRIWNLELTVPKQSTNGQRIITCKLTNRTDRLQALGLGNQMRLLLSLTPTGPPVEYRIQASLVPAGQTVEVLVKTSETEDPARARLKKEGKLFEFPANPRLHAVPPGLEPVAISKVVQVLDSRNAPVRRIDDVVMGTRAKDARHYPAALQPPKWYPAADATAAAPGMPGAPPGAPGSPDGGEGPGGMMRGMMMGGMGAGAGPSKTGAPASVLDANKERYIDVTDQVRRMPVALVLVIDQMFVQDALAAYANSTLRFQVTQFHWNRFRGSLDSPTLTAGGGFGGMGGPPGGDDAGPGGGSGPPPGMSGMGGMSGGPPGMGGMSGMGGFGGMMGGLGGQPSLSEEQVTSGLVELSLYGIVTLYEKYDVPAATPGGAPAGEPPAAPTNPAPPPPAVPPGTPAAPSTPATGRQ